MMHRKMLRGTASAFAIAMATMGVAHAQAQEATEVVTVTGVAILRNNVEPNTVLIRGLPDIQTLLNGREIFSSTGRAITLSDFPSELLQRSFF